MHTELEMNVKYSGAQKALIPLARVATSVSSMEGLLGNNDKIKENDLKPNGKTDLIDGNSTQREIFVKFGETCK